MTQPQPNTKPNNDTQPKQATGKKTDIVKPKLYSI